MKVTTTAWAEEGLAAPRYPNQTLKAPVEPTIPLVRFVAVILPNGGREQVSSGRRNRV